MVGQLSVTAPYTCATEQAAGHTYAFVPDRQAAGEFVRSLQNHAVNPRSKARALPAWQPTKARCRSMMHANHSAGRVPTAMTITAVESCASATKSCPGVSAHDNNTWHS